MYNFRKKWDKLQRVRSIVLQLAFYVPPLSTSFWSAPETELGPVLTATLLTLGLLVVEGVGLLVLVPLRLK